MTLEITNLKISEDKRACIVVVVVFRFSLTYPYLDIINITNGLQWITSIMKVYLRLVTGLFVTFRILIKCWPMTKWHIKSNFLWTTNRSIKRNPVFPYENSNINKRIGTKEVNIYMDFRKNIRIDWVHKVTSV